MKGSENLITQYNKAVEVIKGAILQSQYQAAKEVNRVQLALYFGIGKYVSENSRKGFWGKGAIEFISKQLQKELPGLRGFSANSLKNMRKFYENWTMLDATIPLSSYNSTITNVEIEDDNSTIAIVELERVENDIEINIPMRIQEIQDFPIEDFFRVPFTHHVRIIEGVKDLKTRYYYIHKTAEELLSVDKLIALIKAGDYEHSGTMPSNFVKTLTNASMARKAVMMFKDEYLLDFINVEQIGERESIDVDERVVEKQIVENIKKFIIIYIRF